MHVLYQVLAAPFLDIWSAPAFFGEVLIGGIAAGLMYSLVALGFVLIFKASGVFNFAQGVMVLFAALTLVGLMERGMPVALALAITATVRSSAKTTGTPRSISPTSVSAANSTMTPWAKLKTPEALKISTNPRATRE